MEPNVSEGDLAEFICGDNKGRRCIVEHVCGASRHPENTFGLIWHIYPLQLLLCCSGGEWPRGLVFLSADNPHARDKDLRKVPPEELEDPYTRKEIEPLEVS